MKTRFYALALAIGLCPLCALPGMAQQPNSDQDRPVQPRMDRDDQNAVRQDRDDARRDQDEHRGTDANLQNLLRQRLPNSNIAVNYQNDGTVLLTGNAVSQAERQQAENIVRSQVGNTRIVDQVTVNGYGPGNGTAYGYPNGSRAYPNGTYPNADRDRDRTQQGTQQDNDRYRQDNDANRQNADRDRDNRMPQSDVDSRRDQDRDQARDNDKKHHKNKDKDKKHKKDKDNNDKDNKDRDKDSGREPR